MTRAHRNPGTTIQLRNCRRSARLTQATLRPQPSRGATLRRRLQPHLLEGEIVLGSVRPVARHAWTAAGFTDTDRRLLRGLQVVLLMVSAAMILLIGLALTLLAAVLPLAAADHEGLLAMLLLAPPGVLALTAGTQLLLWPALAVRRALQTEYVLTSHAALVTEPLRQSKPVIARFELEALAPVEARRIRADGIGDILLAADRYRTPGRPRRRPGRWLPGGFFAVPDARRLAVQIEATRRVRRKRAEHEIIAAMQNDYQGYLKRTGAL